MTRPKHHPLVGVDPQIVSYILWWSEFPPCSLNTMADGPELSQRGCLRHTRAFNLLRWTFNCNLCSLVKVLLFVFNLIKINLKVSSSPAAKLNFLAACSLVFRWLLCKDSFPSSARRFCKALLFPFRTISSVEWLSNLDFFFMLFIQVWYECTRGWSLRPAPMATASGWTRRSPSKSHGRQKPNLHSQQHLITFARHMMKVTIMIELSIKVLCVSKSNHTLRIWSNDTANDTKPLQKLFQCVLLNCLHLSPIGWSPSSHLAYCFHNGVSGTFGKEKTTQVASNLVWSFGVFEAQQGAQSLSLPLLCCCFHSLLCCWRNLPCPPNKALGAEPEQFHIVISYHQYHH